MSGYWAKSPPHKVLCGDATKDADVERLMAGEAADLVFTDPPYNVDYEGYTEERLKINFRGLALGLACGGGLGFAALGLFLPLGRALLLGGSSSRRPSPARRWRAVPQRWWFGRWWWLLGWSLYVESFLFNTLRIFAHDDSSLGFTWKAREKGTADRAVVYFGDHEPGAPAGRIVANQAIVSGGGAPSAFIADATVLPRSCAVLTQGGTVMVADVQHLINESLGRAGAVDDLNLDGQVNAVDVQIAVDAILNLGCAATWTAAQ
jgi:hypothetical protein